MIIINIILNCRLSVASQVPIQYKEWFITFKYLFIMIIINIILNCRLSVALQVPIKYKEWFITINILNRNIIHGSVTTEVQSL